MSAIKPRQQSIGRTRSSPLLSAPTTARYRCSRADHDRESWGVAIEMRTISRTRREGLSQTASLLKCSRILGPRIVGIQTIGLELGRDRSRWTHVCLWRGPFQEGPRWHHLRRGYGHQRGQFHVLALPVNSEFLWGTLGATPSTNP